MRTLFWSRAATIGGVFAMLFLATGLHASAKPPGDTVVYHDGKNRVHVAECKRLTKDPQQLAKFKKLTLAEAESKGLQLCSKCPGSDTPGKEKSPNDKLGPAGSYPEAPGAKSGGGQAAKAKGPVVQYAPAMKVYLEAMWQRVHAEDCPRILQKDMMKTMTLEEADKAGYRIGESTASIRGRSYCCLEGYQRKYPELELTDDTTLAGNDSTRNVKHIPGCHRYWPERDHARRPMKDWLEDGFDVCPHCKHRGPSGASVADEAWSQLGAEEPSVVSEGWDPKPLSATQLPSKAEVDMLVQETLGISNGIQEIQFTDTLASLEHFYQMRFFFPVQNWLYFYKAYRSTGDKRILDKLLEAARHYNKLALEHPSVAQKKASDPEGMPFMYSMAAWSRITLQLARRYPGTVSNEEIDEAESMLNTMLSVLRPTCERNDDLDPDIGITKALADDFRSRAFNRAMNGIGMLSMMTAALKDLQAIKKTKEYQPQIDRYRKVIEEYVKNWHTTGHFCDKVDGEVHFVYSYAADGQHRLVDGCKIYKRAEDTGHYSHTLQGVMLMYEAALDVGIDEDFMTAIANAVYRSSTEKVRLGKQKLEKHSGHVECITQARTHPTTSADGKGHQYGPASDRLYMLEAFKPGLIDGLNMTLNAAKRSEVNSEYRKRLATVHAHYMKAFREDPSLIHLGEKR